MKAVILAGGKGTRLKPYTTNFPKPLMPIGDRPILELVINRLRDADIKDIVITTGHLGELIVSFFQNGEKLRVNITYSKEDTPLGTAGPLNLAKEQLTDTFLVMNGDVISNIDFSQLIEFHKKRCDIATVALSRRKVNIDYGVVEITGENIFSEWNEKPSFEYLVSMGIYVFEPAALKSLPKEGFFNLPDFIKRLHIDEEKISCFIHDGYWLDIGRPEDYERACRDYGNGVFL